MAPGSNYNMSGEQQQPRVVTFESLEVRSESPGYHTLSEAGSSKSGSPILGSSSPHKGRHVGKVEIPPPVPKKQRQKSSIPLIGRPKRVPLSKVQPLQIQSPSMIRALHGESLHIPFSSSPSSSNNSLDSSATFIVSRNSSNKKKVPPSLIPLPPKKKRQSSSSEVLLNSRNRLTSKLPPPPPPPSTAGVNNRKPLKKTEQPLGGPPRRSTSLEAGLGKKKHPTPSNNCSPSLIPRIKKSVSRSHSNISSLSPTYQQQQRKAPPPQVLKRSLSERSSKSSSTEDGKFQRKIKSTVSSTLKKLTSSPESGSRKKLSNPITSLIKFYECRDDKKASKTATEVEQTPDHILRESLSNISLSELSQLGADRLSNWLINPLRQSNEEADEIRRKSVLDIIEDIEKRKKKVMSKVIEPHSEGDMNHGVFTEVSYAGTFAASIANRQAKSNKKARKDQMLLEHKANGRAALSQLLGSKKDDDTEEDIGSLLEDLCSQSRNIILEKEGAMKEKDRQEDEITVFLKAGVYAHLEEERDEKLSDQITNLQALCRGYLARKRIQRLKVQDIAIRCIQKNVRKFMGVRGWHWWRLLIKITPMLNVHRTEDQLKSKTSELESLKMKLDKLEKENKEYKVRNERLDAKLSEMTADLAEEHSTATLATERLEAEQSERMKLEKERDDLSTANKRLHGTNERMEAELLYSRAVDMNGLSSFDDVDEDGEPSFYKQKYERAMKELEFAKKRLQQQHEDDLEQLMAVKKQLEKKLNDAYEEVDEQRNLVAQWKRKTQKATGESNDFKHLFEEQSSRNILLEKKQRKFDAEIASLVEENKKEILARDKIQRELDGLKNIKYSLEDQVHALKLDLEFKEEKINALNKELEDLVNGGAVEEEISLLKKQKSELDARLMDQEEELDDLAGQVQMLEQSKVKLEMSIAAQKKEHRKELSSKEEELEDARAAAQKRIKALEQQLENEHEERMGFVREKHDLETKIMNLQELASRSTDEEYVIKLKKNLKKTKALLKDAQCMIDMNRNDSSNKIVLRQLKNQLEDAEFAKTAAIKSRQNTEMELTEVQQQLDDVMRSKNDIEDKMMRICREKSDALTQLEDNEEELSDIMKKYKAAVSQLSVDQITITQQTTQITELEEERHRLKETLSELNQKIDNLESDNISSVTHSRLELKIRELESKLELEQATRGRMETQIGRLKEAIEKYNHECDILRNKELNSQDMARKLQRQLRDSKEDYASLAQKEMEANSKKVEYEKQLELAEAEVITVKNDLKLALKRFDQLQASLEGDSSEGDCGSDGESDSSDCEVSIFLDHHRRAMSVQKERESVVRELSAQRELRASVAREMSLRPLETMSELPEEAH